MPIDLQNLDGLGETAVQARLLRLTELVDGLGVGSSVKRGFIRDHVLRLHAILGEAYSQRLDIVGRSLNPLIASSGEVDTDIVGLTAATYGLSRQDASFATGTIRIEVSDDQSVIIPSGTVLAATDNRSYRTSQSFIGRTLAAEIQTNTDRQLVRNADGNYEFLIEATATLAGLSGNLVAGTELQLTAINIRSLVRITVATEFTGGRLEETDSQLISRIRGQLPAKTLSTRASIAATLSQVSILPGLLAVSSIGYGDEEMVRSRRRGADGRGVDVYLRTQPLAETTQFLLKAEVTEVRSDGHLVWSVAIGRDVAPGFYRVLSVRAAELGDFTDLVVTRGRDTSPIEGELSPLITDNVDAVFSRYQTATVTGVTASREYIVGNTVNVNVTLSYMPGVQTAQQTVNSRRYRFVGGDTLVRAAIPTYVSVGIDIHAKPSAALPDPQPIKDAVAAMFNESGFAGRLHGSRVASTIHRFLPAGADVGSLSFVLETLLPNGEIKRVRTKDHIDVPNLPNIAVSSRTSIFLCDPAAISIAAYAETLPELI